MVVLSFTKTAYLSHFLRSSVSVDSAILAGEPAGSTGTMGPCGEPESATFDR